MLTCSFFTITMAESLIGYESIAQASPHRNWLPSEPGHFAQLPALAIFREEHICAGSLLPEQDDFPHPVFEPRFLELSIQKIRRVQKGVRR